MTVRYMRNGKPVTIKQLSSIAGISITAMRYRIKKLGIAVGAVVPEDALKGERFKIKIFGSRKLMSVAEIAARTGLSEDETRAALRKVDNINGSSLDEIKQAVKCKAQNPNSNDQQPFREFKGMQYNIRYQPRPDEQAYVSCSGRDGMFIAEKSAKRG